MMTGIQSLITDHIDIWTSSIKSKSAVGRGSSKKIDLYGIKKLRELVLQLAIMGKLVPQDPNDEPASVLLDRIALKKERLTKEKKIKKPKILSKIEENEKFFTLPSGWNWSRLNDLGEWGAGATPRRSDLSLYGGSIPWFKSGELNSDYISKSEETVTELALKKASLRFNQVGDVLLAMYGATIGKTSILSVAATTNQAVCACTPFQGLANTYLLMLLKSYRSRFIGMGAGGAQPNISREKIIQTVIALPPLQEQKRIVAKVDELMLLCDDLENQTENSIASHKTLVETLLSTLTGSQSHQEFTQNWTRISDHFHTLFTTEHSIDQLKKTILQLAVMGKLVPQNPNDEPASILLDKIAQEKEQLIKEKKIKRQKALPEIGEDEKPFDLPVGWEWSRLGILFNGGSGSTPSRNKPRYFLNGTESWFKTTDLNLEYVFTGQEKITKEAVKDCNLSYYPKDTVCLAMYGGGGTIGKSGILGVPSTINQSVFALPPSTNFCPLFLHLYIKSIRYGWMRFAAGLRKDPNINGMIIKKMVCPVPPLQEQKRIVSKVDEIMALCDQVKSNLIQAKQTQLTLTDTIVDEGYKA